MKNPPGFYVYEHWRTDKDICFYVGKGQRGRAYSITHRNRHHKRVMAKLHRTGFAMEVRIVQSGMTEDDAFTLEIERIAFWRGVGAKLANIAAGGIGASGRKFSEAERRALGERKRGNKNRLGAKLSDETKEKIAAAHRGKKLTPEHLAKMSDSARGEKNPFFGKTHTPETGAKISAANRGRKWSDESRAKLSASLTGIRHTPRTTTWTHTDETKKKMSDAAKRRPAKSAETRAKISASLSGRILGPRSAETRAKMRASHKGISPETRKKMLETRRRNRLEKTSEDK